MADASYSVNLSFTSFAKARPFGVMEISAEPIRAPRSPDPDERSRPFSRCAQVYRGGVSKRRRTGPPAALAGPYPQLDADRPRRRRPRPAGGSAGRSPGTAAASPTWGGRPRPPGSRRPAPRASRGPRSAVRPPPPSGRTRRPGCGRSSPATSGRPRRRCRAAAAGRARSRSAPGRSGRSSAPDPLRLHRALRSLIPSACPAPRGSCARRPRRPGADRPSSAAPGPAAGGGGGPRCEPGRARRTRRRGRAPEDRRRVRRPAGARPGAARAPGSAARPATRGCGPAARSAAARGRRGAGPTRHTWRRTSSTFAAASASASPVARQAGS